MVLIGRAQQALEQVAAELTGRGTQTAVLCIDLASSQAGGQIERALADRGLYCDVLINSAGFGLFGPAAEMDRDDQLNLFDVNARTLTELTLRFLPGMVARRRGGILNVGSLTGYTPGPNMAVYYASKTYVRSFSAAISAEVENTGVTITCLCPGPVRTAFFERCAVGQTQLSRIMPRANASDTAEAGWHGFKTGKSLVIPRRIDRMIAALMILLPDNILVRLVRAFQKAPAPVTRAEFPEPRRARRFKEQFRTTDVVSTNSKRIPETELEESPRPMPHEPGYASTSGSARSAS